MMFKTGNKRGKTAYIASRALVLLVIIAAGTLVVSHHVEGGSVPPVPMPDWDPFFFGWPYDLGPWGPCSSGYYPVELAGPGLFVHFTSGNVWTEVPIVQTETGLGGGLNLVFRYDSVRSLVDGPLGYGWSHKYEVCIKMTGTDAIYHGSSGRRWQFKYENGAYVCPSAASAELVKETGLFKLTTPDGLVRRFNSADKLESITDRSGRITRLSYDASNRLEEVVSPYGRKFTFSYDASDRIETVTDPDTEVTTLTYNANGELWKITDPINASSTLEYWYGPSHRMSREILKNGKWYKASYYTSGDNEYREIRDSNNNIIAKLCSGSFPATRSVANVAGNVAYTDGRGKNWAIVRDDQGRITEMGSPWPNRQTRYYTYGTSGNGKGQLIEVEDERGNSKYLEYDANGVLSKVTDAEGNETEYEYGTAGFGNSALLTKKIEPDDDEWVYEYDTAGNLTKLKDPVTDDGPGGVDATIDYTYAEYHSPTAAPGTAALPLPGRLKIMNATDRNGKLTKYEYDGYGNLTRVIADPGPGSGDLNLTTQYEYDNMGRMTKEIVHRGDRNISTKLTYDALGRVLTVTEDEGTAAENLNLTAEFTYDYHGNLTKVKDPRGQEMVLEYDHRNRQTAEEVADGTLDLRTEWEYDGNDNVVTVRDPNHTTATPHVTTLVYDDRNILAEIIDAEGLVTNITPDAVGNIVRQDRYLTPGTTGDKYSVAMQYDALNRVTSVTQDPDGEALSTQIVYEGSSGCGCGGTPNRALPHKITDPMGKITYNKYDRMDRLIEVIRKVGDTNHEADPNDVVVKAEYDAQGFVTAMIGAEDERIEYVYDDAGRVTRTKAINPAVGQDDLVNVMGYDGASNPTTIRMPNGNTTTLVYDGAGRLTLASDDVGAIAELEYDANGNITRLVDGENNASRFEYDTADRVIKVYDALVESGTDKYTEFTYDNAGNRITTTNNNGVVTKYVYDKLHRLTRTTEDYGTGKINRDTWTTYNGANQVVTLKDDDNNTTTYTYNDLGRLTKVAYPDSDDVDFVYDDAGNLSTRTDQKGVVTTYAYDDLHRLTSRSYSTGGSETFAYDKSGRPTSADNSLVDVDLDYDDLGRLIQEKHTFSSPSSQVYTVDYAHAIMKDAQLNPIGMRQTISYPGNRTVEKDYDKRLRLAKVNGGTRIEAAWGFDDANRRTSATLGNLVSSLFEYDVNGRLINLRHGPAGTPLYHVQHGYDAVGNRLYTKDVRRPFRSELYQYDALNRLRKFQRGRLASTNDSIDFEIVHPVLTGRQEWTGSTPGDWMDARGNWLQSTTVRGGMATTQTRSVNGVNEYTSIDPDGPAPAGPLAAIAMTSDDNGNLTFDPLAPNAGSFDPGQHYVYDAENRLTQVTRDADSQTLQELRYDALGRRVESVRHVSPEDGVAYGIPQVTRHVYSGLVVLEEYDISSDGAGGNKHDRLRDFVWGDRFPEPIAMIDRTAAGEEAAGVDEPFHYLHDALGSVVALTDDDGDVVERYTYDPYGRTYVEDATPGAIRYWSNYGNPYMWTGQRYDAETRLYHFLFRSYSPELGRWLQRDPLGYVDGMSLYQYVGSKPVTWIDPLGLEPPNGPPWPPGEGPFAPNNRDAPKKGPAPKPSHPKFKIIPMTPMPNIYPKEHLEGAVEVTDAMGGVDMPGFIEVGPTHNDNSGETSWSNIVRIWYMYFHGRFIRGKDLADTLRKNPFLLNLILALIHEQAHTKEGFWEKFWRNPGRDGPNGYQAEVDFLKKLLGLLNEKTDPGIYKKVKDALKKAEKKLKIQREREAFRKKLDEMPDWRHADPHYCGASTD